MGQLASRQMPIVLAEQGRPILTLSEGMATELVAETDSGAQLSLIFNPWHRLPAHTPRLGVNVSSFLLGIVCPRTPQG